MTSRIAETKRLNAREERFALEYLRDRNGAAAYRRAGYAPRDADIAAAAASRLLRDVRVAARGEELENERTSRTQVEGDRVIQELAKIAFANLHDVVGWNAEGVHVRDADRLHPDVLAAVKKIRMNQRGGSIEVSVTLHDKIRALIELARIRGLHDPSNQAPAEPPVDFETIRNRIIEKLQRINERREAATAS
jgi:phage terminase small subunit